MADRRPEVQEMSRAKKPKIASTDFDPSKNPYLKHMYEEEPYGNEYSNGESGAGFKNFVRHETTASQAHIAEDGPLNPFNNKPFSQRYFNILKTRRDLPVHKQRYDRRFFSFGQRVSTNMVIDRNSWTCSTRLRFSSSSVRLVPEKLLKFLSSSCSMTYHTSAGNLLHVHSHVE